MCVPQEPHKLAKKIGWENNLSMSEQATETVDPNPDNRASCQGERAKLKVFKSFMTVEFLVTDCANQNGSLQP